MEIIRSYQPKPAPLAEFADAHRLKVRVHERRPGAGPRFYAVLEADGYVVEYVEPGHEGTLASLRGDGETESGAIANLCARISGTTLVLSHRPGVAYRDRVPVPTLFYHEEETAP